jgi:hypothetical protein
MRAPKERRIIRNDIAKKKKKKGRERKSKGKNFTTNLLNYFLGSLYFSVLYKVDDSSYLLVWVFFSRYQKVLIALVS